MTDIREQPGPSTTPTPERWYAYSTKTLMVCAALGAVFAVLYGGYTLGEAAILPVAPMVIAYTSGMWFALPLLAMLYVRKVGVGVLTAALGALLVGVFNPFGLQLVPFAIAYAVVVEIPFAVTRWRRFGVGITVTVSVIVGIVSLGLFSATFAASGFALWLLVLMGGLLLVVFLGWGLLTLVLARALRRVLGGRR